ncbi:hypothetical protein REPUB_Repub13aG0058400 [Reevesia pubescens]
MFGMEVIKNRRLVVCGTAFWSLWLARNESVFSNKGWDCDEVLFIIKLRSLFCIKAVENGHGIDEALWWNEPSFASRGQTVFKPRQNVVWCCPGVNELKFNVMVLG